MKLLRPKYVVRKATPKDIEEYKRIGPHHHVIEITSASLSTDPEDINSPFVLMPRKDPSAFAALITYCQVCEPQLAQEIAEWMIKIANAEPQFGSQGTRNYASVRMQAVNEIKVSR